MQHRNIEKILNTLSPQRLNAYHNRGSEPNAIDDLAVYAWNAALGASLYPLIQMIEVSLRNSLYQAIKDLTEQKLWFDDITLLHPIELKIIKNTRAGLKKIHLNMDADHLISELSFGFWTNLLDKRYEQALWPRLLKTTFPYIPRSQRTRAFIARRINRIRILRNRISHHQRIWHWCDLAIQHKDALQVLSWIDPSTMSFLNIIDTFPVIYTSGTAQYKEQIITLFNPDYIQYQSHNSIELLNADT